MAGFQDGDELKQVGFDLHVRVRVRVRVCVRVRETNTKTPVLVLQGTNEQRDSLVFS